MMKSVESLVSRNLYELNKENLRKSIELQKMRSSKISFHNLKSFFLRIFYGGFKKTIRRLFNKKRIGDREFVLKDYDAYPQSKVVVYTSIFGKYDGLLEPFFVSENIDYFVITDSEIPKESIWKKMDIDLMNQNEHMSPVQKNRFCKMLPHRFFRQYDYSIYIDGNIRVVTDLMPLICDLGQKTIGIHDYQTNCIYEMKNSIIIGKRAHRKDVIKQINKYKKEGFPKEFGAFECNVIVRKHNDELCAELMEKWWEEFESTTSKRDQLSLPYVLWKNGLSKDYVCSLGYHVRENPRFIVYPKHSGAKK